MSARRSETLLSQKQEWPRGMAADRVEWHDYTKHSHERASGCVRVARVRCVRDECGTSPCAPLVPAPRRRSARPLGPLRSLRPRRPWSASPNDGEHRESFDVRRPFFLIAFRPSFRLSVLPFFHHSVFAFHRYRERNVRWTCLFFDRAPHIAYRVRVSLCVSDLFCNASASSFFQTLISQVRSISPKGPFCSRRTHCSNSIFFS